MTLEAKVKIYQLLLAALNKGVKLAAILDREGATQDRAKVERRNEQLAKLAADLRKNISRDWQSGASAITEAIQKSSSQLQRSIKNIDETIATAATVIKALGYLDDLIDLAKNVAAAIA